jgi:hypothetical protein
LGKDISLRVDNASEFVDTIYSELGLSLDETIRDEYVSDLSEIEGWLDERSEPAEDAPSKAIDAKTIDELNGIINGDEPTNGYVMLILILRQAMLRILTAMPVGTSVYVKEASAELVVINFSYRCPGSGYYKII